MEGQLLESKTVWESMHVAECKVDDGIRYETQKHDT